MLTTTNNETHRVDVLGLEFSALEMVGALRWQFSAYDNTHMNLDMVAASGAILFPVHHTNRA